MRRKHFDVLKPICPVCRNVTGELHPLILAEVVKETDQSIIEGVLHCSHVNCLREYPIIDGIPLIIANIREYLSSNAFQVCQRDDFSPTIESMLGDCCGAGSSFDVVRQHLSSYTWDHYADLDPAEVPISPQPGSLQRLLESGLSMAAELQPGPILDIGCSVGGSTFAMAAKYNRMVLGVDLNYPMLRLAQRVLLHGRVKYPRRRVGLVYDHREFPVSSKHAEQVDFWACDATALPLPEKQFAAAISMNLLDCVHSPLDFLTSMAANLQVGGQAIVACPYDWSTSATPVEGWLGGHSQRSVDRGASEPALRRMLSPGNPQSIAGLQFIAECEADWQVRLHERSCVAYKAHVVVARKGY